MTERMMEENRPIRAVYFGTTCYSVDERDITSIVPYTELDSLWFAVYKKSYIYARIPAGNNTAIYY
jgi:hypothetical protein